MGGATQDDNAVTWFLDRHLAEGRGGATAFTDPARSLSYAGLAEASARFAGGLSARPAEGLRWSVTAPLEVHHA